MSRKSKMALSALLGMIALAGCTTTPEQDAARAEAQAQRSAEISARQGAAVNDICPGRVDGWKAFGNDVLLLEARGKWYMAELAGTCHPESAFSAIVTRSGVGSSCLTRGDDVFTARPRSGGRCVITAIYEWDESAEVPATVRGTPVDN